MGLQKVFRTRDGDLPALRSIDLAVPRGQFCCVVGPSGCGKTTLLRMLAGLEPPTGGLLEIVHEDERRPCHAMVFQEQSVFPWLTVRENIAYGLKLRGMAGPERRRIVDHYLEKTGLTRFADAYPFQLSGGMKQRVSVARAFAIDPEVLLMDEPFAALDEQNRTLLHEELLRICEETRKTVVFITHSIDEALVLGDRVVVMSAQPGTIKADLAVPFPRPRAVYELKATPEFGSLAFRVWDQLREEVMRARSLERGQLA